MPRPRQRRRHTQPQSHAASPSAVLAARHAPLPRVSTLLLARERGALDRAAATHVGTLHREDVRTVLEDFHAGRSTAVIVSERWLHGSPDALATLIRRASDARVVAVTDRREANVHGRPSARQRSAQARSRNTAIVVRFADVSTAHGWRSIVERLSVRHFDEPPPHELVTATLRVLGDVSAGCVRFVTALFEPTVADGAQVARELGLDPEALARRCERAGIPSPKRYVDEARLIRAAYRGEDPVARVDDIARAIGCPTRQSFNRMVRRLTGSTANEFRHRNAGSARLDRFLEVMILPHQHALQQFDPYARARRDKRHVSR